MIITPATLVKGAKIGIVATARKINMQEIEGAIAMIKDWGFIPVVGATIGQSEHQYGGDDELRATDIQQMLDDPEIKAVWCARGGYGTVRIIDNINFTKFIQQPKWIIGYSDVTVLHSHIHKLNIVTLHAPLVMDVLNSGKKAQEYIYSVLVGNEITYDLNLSTHNKMGKGKGMLVGGNLSILYSLCGSNSHIDTQNKILFIEDLDEYLYHVDRMMQNLKRTGMLANLQGLIVGGMTKMHDNTIPFGKTVEEIILDTVKDYNYPVLFDFPAGHIEHNYALILGKTVTLEASNEGARVVYQ